MSPLFESLVRNSFSLMPVDEAESPLQVNEQETLLQAEGSEEPKFQLQLNDKEINLEELEDLLAYPRITMVRDLQLARNEFGDEGVAQIADSVSLCRLVFLWLGYNKLTDAAASGRGILNQTLF